MIRPIYEEFLDVVQSRDENGELTRRYLQPHSAFFRPYLAFMSQGSMGWKEFTDQFEQHWSVSSGHSARLKERLSGQDVERLIRSGYQRASRLLGPLRDVDAYVCVGLEMSNAFMVEVAGEPSVGIALEAYGRTFGTSYVDFEDILHVLPHELCHAVRARETGSLLRRFFRKDPVTAFDGEPMHELVVEEGLAVSVGRAAAPDVPLARVLFYDPGDLRWCEENEPRLFEEFAAQRELSLDGKRYQRYFAYGEEGQDIPTRTGYYLGYKLVQRFLEKNPCISLSEAVRMPAEHVADY